MRRFLKTIATRCLSVVNAYPTSCTKVEQLRELIQNLHPVHAGVDLVRLGPQTDGGYLAPDDLEGIQACFSPGVSFQSGFELDCANRGMLVFMADQSVDCPSSTHRYFHFTKTNLGVTTSADSMTLDDWVAESLPGSQSDLLLQMDVEGCEYEVILGVSDKLLSRFRIIIVEFHWLDQLWSFPFFRVASRAFAKLLQTHICVHIHPNNYESTLHHGGLTIPKLAEFTFLRRDRVANPTFVTHFPHELDADNTSNLPLTLPPCWYRPYSQHW
jgi:hypothetical protein